MLCRRPNIVNHNKALLVVTYTDERQYKVLNDKTLRRIARKAAKDLSDLGYELDLDSTDFDAIICQHKDKPTDQAFYILKVSCQRMVLLSLTPGGVLDHLTTSRPTDTGIFNALNNCMLL